MFSYEKEWLCISWIFLSKSSCWCVQKWVTPLVTQLVYQVTLDKLPSFSPPVVLRLGAFSREWGHWVYRDLPPFKSLTTKPPSPTLHRLVWKSAPVNFYITFLNRKISIFLLQILFFNHFLFLDFFRDSIQAFRVQH